MELGLISLLNLILMLAPAVSWEAMMFANVRVVELAVTIAGETMV